MREKKIHLLMTSQGMRLSLDSEYYEGSALLKEQLPLTGIIEREIPSFSGVVFSLLALDDPFDFQIEDKVAHRFKGFTVNRILIRSRYHDVPLGGREPTSVFVLIAEDDHLFEVDKIDVDSLHFVAWANCFRKPQV